MRTALKRIALGLVLGLGALLGTGTAHAQDYYGDCSNVPTTTSGNVTIIDSSCNLSHDVIASGEVYISISGNLTAQNIIAYTGLTVLGQGGVSASSLTSQTAQAYIRSDGGNVNVGSVTAGGAVTLQGQAGVTAQDVTSQGEAYIRSDGGEVQVESVTTGGSGNLTLQGQEGVTANDTVYADGSAYIRSDEGDVSLKDLQAGDNYIQVIASDGKITIDGDVTGWNLTQVYWASEDISLHHIENYEGYDVRIFANQGGGATPFSIGTSSDNGVFSVHNNGSSGFRIIYISNGDGNGGIEYSGNDVLQVQNSSGPSGTVVLDGRANGNVTLSGTLSVSGANGSGVIDIFAPQVISNGATLSANSPGQQVGFINLTTDAIALSGSLTLNVNGDGLFSTYYDLSIFPVGSYSLNAPADPSMTITANPYSTAARALAITGSGALTINANGNRNAIKVEGFPLTISNSGGMTVNNIGSNNQTLINAAGSTATFGAGVQIHANTTASGQSPNQITVTANTIAGLTANALLDATGHTGGSGSNITSTASTGTVNIGGTGAVFTLNANGSSTGGNAGSITVTVPTVNLVSDNGALASASGGNGRGGNIDISATTLQLTSGQTIHVNAKGFNSGDGGHINIESATFTTEDGTIDVSGGSTSGSGGTISVATTNDFTLGGTATKANFLAQGHGSGAGGNITISPGFLNAKLDRTVIDASGGDAGDGGNVVAGNAIHQFDVNTVILVDSEAHTTGSNHGSISLNGVRCRLYKNGATSWPDRYWNCAHPDSPSSLDANVLFAAGTYPHVNTSMSVWQTQLYVFSAQQASDTFFNNTNDPATRGVTYVEPVNWTKAYVAIAENHAHDGSGTDISGDELRENTAHELGHVIDFTVGLDSASTDFDKYVQNDWANLDYYYNGTSYVARPACTSVSTYSIIPPFQGIGIVCDPITGALNPAFSGMSNHQILQNIAEYYFTTGASTPQSWKELWATAYAYEIYSWNNIGWFAIRPDQLFTNGYFPCVRTWLNTVDITGSRPVGGGACSANVPIPGWTPVH